ncbi:MAG: integrase, partial [Planctomycetota bacterium]
MQEIRAPIECTAGDNLRWGYCRIQGKLKKLGHGFARPAIAKTLKDHGVPPSGRRATSWRRFFRAQEDTIAATDYFTAEVWTKRGLVTHYILFVIDHATRAVEITGCTTRSDAAFMAQFARDLADLADLEDGVLRRKSFLVLDRDSTFAAQFHRILGDAGVTTFHTAFQAPNMKAIDERFIN